MNLPPRPDLPPVPPPPGRHAAADLPAATWSWYGAVGIYLLGTFIAGALIAVGTGGEPNSPAGFFISAFVGQILPTVGLLVWLQVSHKAWRASMGAIAIRTRDLGFGVVGGLVAYLAGAFGLGIALAILYRVVTGEELTTPEQIPVQISGVRILLAILMAVVLAPLVEEFFFRGILFRGFRARYGFWPSALGSAAIFGFAHYSFEEGLPVFGRFFLVILMFFVGMCFAWIYERRGSLWASVAAHMTFNIIGLALIAASG